jgi:hypothetical protein
MWKELSGARLKTEEFIWVARAGRWYKLAVAVYGQAVHDLAKIILHLAGFGVIYPRLR